MIFQTSLTTISKQSPAFTIASGRCPTACFERFHVLREVSLKELPELIFDSQEWEAFSFHFDSEIIAIERLSQLVCFPHEFFRKNDSKKPNTEERVRACEEHLYCLSKSFLATLKEQAAYRKLVATGIKLGLTDRIREEIGPSLWEKAWPDFSENELRSSNFRYIDVRVRIHDQPQLDADELQKHCVNWLRSMAAVGEDRKKILANKARE